MRRLYILFICLFSIYSCSIIQRANTVLDEDGRIVLFDYEPESDVIDLENIRLVGYTTNPNRKIQKLKAVHSYLSKDVSFCVDTLILLQGSVVEGDISRFNPAYLEIEINNDRYFYPWCGCKTLKELVIHSSDVKRIDAGNFALDSALERVVLPSSLRAIDFKSFSGCKQLQSVVIPPGVEDIGEAAFMECTSLKEIELPPNIKELPKECFYGCSSLEVMNIPSHVEWIGKRCFAGCIALREVTIPESVKILEDYCFLGCDALDDLIIPQTVKSIGRDITSKSTKIHLLSDDVEPTDDVNAWGDSSPTHGILYVNLNKYEYFSRKFPRAMVLPSGPLKTLRIVMESGGSILSHINVDELPIIDSLTIQGPINEIDIDIIRRCVSLSYLDLSNSSPSLSSEGIKALKNAIETGNALLGLIAWSQSTPPGTLSIMSEDEYRRRKITKSLAEAMIVSPSKAISHIKALGGYLPDECFKGMFSLKEIRMPQKMKRVPAKCFIDCTSLEKVILPTSVQVIEGGNFGGGKIRDITFPGTLVDIQCEFESDSIQHVDLSKSLCDGDNTSFGDWHKCRNISVFILPSKITKVDLSCLPQGRAKISIPSTVKNLSGSVSNCEMHFQSLTPPGGGKITDSIIFCPKKSLTTYYSKYATMGNKVLPEDESPNN